MDLGEVSVSLYMIFFKLGITLKTSYVQHMSAPGYFFIPISHLWKNTMFHETKLTCFIT